MFSRVTLSVRILKVKDCRTAHNNKYTDDPRQALTQSMSAMCSSPLSTSVVESLDVAPNATTVEACVEGSPSRASSPPPEPPPEPPSRPRLAGAASHAPFPPGWGEAVEGGRGRLALTMKPHPRCGAISLLSTSALAGAAAPLLLPSEALGMAHHQKLRRWTAG